MPGLRGQGRSEAVVLQGATAYTRSLLAERWRLLQRARGVGVDVARWEVDEVTGAFAREAAREGAGGGG